MINRFSKILYCCNNMHHIVIKLEQIYASGEVRKSFKLLGMFFFKCEYELTVCNCGAGIAQLVYSDQARDVRRWNRGCIPGKPRDLYVVHSVQTDSGMHPATYLIDTEDHSRGGA